MNLDEALREIERRDELLAGADADLREAIAEVARLKAVLNFHRFRRCDIAACNCGSWHAGPNERAERAEAERDAARVLLEEAESLLLRLFEGCHTDLGDHEDGCSEDDTCDCAYRPMADAFNSTMAKLAEVRAREAK